MDNATAALREKHAIERAARLPIWKGAVTPVRLPGGITNMNFTVEDAASKAACASGVSPEVVHTEPGILVSRYIPGKTLTAADIRDPARLPRIVPMLKRVHRDMPHYLRGPLLAFWVFHVIRDYAHTLQERGSRHAPRLPELVDIAEGLELEVGPVDFVFGHNDLLPSNFIDDGKRVWMIDWDYAGWNSPLFDLSNLASNAEFSREQEERLLTAYFGRAPDTRMWTSYTAMKCASLLREAMWSMVSEITSQLDFDYASYTEDYLARFVAADSVRKAAQRT
jgi:thiamine kinase-like enzyme